MDTNPHHEGEGSYDIPRSSAGVVNLSVVLNFGRHETIADDFNFYPQHDEMPELVREIAAHTRAGENEILVTNGSGNALLLILRTFHAEGKRVLVPIPNYPGFIHDAALIYGRENLILEKDPMPFIPMADVIYFSSPNIPLGTSLPSSFIDVIESFPDKLFIIDEAYIEYGEADGGFFSPSSPPNLIVTRTFSKAFMLAGARIGYVLAREEIISTLRVAYCDKDVLDLSIEMALAVMRDRHQYIARARRDMERMRALASKIGSLISSGSMIRGISYGDAPFFLLKTWDSGCVPYLVSLYERGGFLIRDKSNEIEGAARVTMMGEDDEERFLLLTMDICGRGEYKALYLDLDGTLRSSRSSPLFPSVGLLSGIDIPMMLVTNSTQNRGEILSLLDDADISIPMLSPSIPAASQQSKKGYAISEDSVYIYRFPDIDRELISALKRCRCMRAVELSMYEMLSEDRPLEEGEEDERIPFVGLFLSFMRDTYPWMEEVRVELIGKGAWDLAEKPFPSLMIGDADNDLSFAQRNGLFFYRVDGTEASLREVLLHMIEE